MRCFQIANSIEKATLAQQIIELGGIYIEGSTFRPKSTHYICKAPKKTLFFYSALAHGAWILVPQYVTDSRQAGSWLPETGYEVAPSLRPAMGSGQLKFKGWQACFWPAKENNEQLLAKLIESAGGSTVRSPTRRPTRHCPPITHFFCRLQDAWVANSELIPIHPDYIFSYLENPDVPLDCFLIGHYNAATPQQLQVAKESEGPVDRLQLCLDRLSPDQIKTPKRKRRNIAKKRCPEKKAPVGQIHFSAKRQRARPRKKKEKEQNPPQLSKEYSSSSEDDLVLSKIKGSKILIRDPSPGKSSFDLSKYLKDENRIQTLMEDSSEEERLPNSKEESIGDKLFEELTSKAFLSTREDLRECEDMWKTFVLALSKYLDYNKLERFMDLAQKFMDPDFNTATPILRVILHHIWLPCKKQHLSDYCLMFMDRTYRTHPDQSHMFVECLDPKAAQRWHIVLSWLKDFIDDPSSQSGQNKLQAFTFYAELLRCDLKMSVKRGGGASLARDLIWPNGQWDQGAVSHQLRCLIQILVGLLGHSNIIQKVGPGLKDLVHCCVIVLRRPIELAEELACRLYGAVPKLDQVEAGEICSWFSLLSPPQFAASVLSFLLRDELQVAVPSSLESKISNFLVPLFSVVLPPDSKALEAVEKLKALAGEPKPEFRQKLVRPIHVLFATMMVTLEVVNLKAKSLEILTLLNQLIQNSTSPPSLQTYMSQLQLASFF